MTIDAHFRVTRPSFELNVEALLPGQGVTAVFGPSGSGKTTLLRCIAGLEKTTQGRLIVGDMTWQDETVFLPVHQRPLGYVFQEASLFPHLTVTGNLRYGWRRVPHAERRIPWDDIVDLLGLNRLLDRMPSDLSGGERQRVALARALLTSPQLLLMDEPLSALDYARKQDVLPYLERLNRELKLPCLYVSHSIDEVVRLADHIVLIDNGRLVAQGPLQETFARLDIPFAIADVGVVIEATVAHHDEQWHLTQLNFRGGSVRVSKLDQPIGKKLRFQLHARDVSLSRLDRTESTILNHVQGTVIEIAPADTPAHVHVKIEAQGTPIIARITRLAASTLAIDVGQSVWAQVKSVALLG